MKNILVTILFVLSGICAKAQYDYQFDELILEKSDSSLFNTASLKGKIIYVDFWFTACAPCIKEIEPFKELQQYFATDTNISFLSICIENNDRKSEWRKLIKEHSMFGNHLFYARNKPQKVNLLRKYDIVFPTYLIVDKTFKVTGYDAPRPSEKRRTIWALHNALLEKTLKESDKAYINRTNEYRQFIIENKL